MKVWRNIDKANACKQLEALCAISTEWGDWCGEDNNWWLYDEANKAFGYYGALGTFAAVQAHYATEVKKKKLAKSRTTHAETPKTYFTYACKFTFEDSWEDFEFADYEYLAFYEARLLQQLEATGTPSMKYVGHTLTRYAEIAKVAVQQPENPNNEQQSNASYFRFVQDYDRLDGVRGRAAWIARDSNELKHVKRGIPEYVDIAKLAVGSDAYALGHVLYSRVVLGLLTDKDYGEIAKVAVARRGSALFLVDARCAYYVEIAKIAVHQFGRALAFVNRDHDEYGDIALIAANQNGLVLEYVPLGREDFFDIAQVAVRKNGEALQYVATDHANYYDLAKASVNAQSASLYFVDPEYARYGEIAMQAVVKNRNVLEYVDPEFLDSDDYLKIAWHAVQENPEAFEDVRTWDGAEYGAHEEIAELMVKHGNGSWLDYFDDDTRNVDYAKLTAFAISEQGGEVLQYVKPGCDNYAYFAKLAVQNNALALEYVNARAFPHSDDYYRLAEFAVTKNRDAFEHVSQCDKSRYKQLETFARKWRCRPHRVR